MKSFPLAILLVFRNQKELAEKTLTNIYRNLHSNFELYIIDDASDDDTRQTIQSVVGHFAHDHTYFFENSSELGREKCIKELLQQVSTPFIWMPLAVDNNLTELADLHSLVKPGVDARQGDKHADKITEVNQGAEGSKLRPDSLAAAWLSTGDEASEDEKSLVPDVPQSRDIPPLKSPKPVKAPVKFRPTSRMHSLVLPENASEAAENIFSKLDEYVQEGEYLYALKLVDAEQARFPLDSDLIRLKIKILELMRRYVEAAELKHQLKLGGPGVARPKIRRESILIVDPTEDYEGTALVDLQDSSRPEESGISSHERIDKSEDNSKDAKETQVPDFDEFDDDFDSGVIGVPKPMSTPKAREIDEVEEPPQKGVDEIHDEPATDEIQKPDGIEEPAGENQEATGQSEEQEPGPGAAEIEPEKVVNEDVHVADESGSDEKEQEQEQEPYDPAKDVLDDENKAASEAASRDPAFLQPVDPQVKPAAKEVFSGEYSDSPLVSIIIPTTIDGKGLLERTVYSLSKHADGPDRELIIIDNASLDDTYDYLRQLKKENFMQVRVVTNHENMGFARSANQGMELARGKYILIMHNDVVVHDDLPGKMARLMDSHPEINILGPTAPVTMCDAQKTKTPDDDEGKIVKTRYIDSFCMMLRKDKLDRFDEQYGLAYFDDMDYCMSDAKHGGGIAVAVGLKVDHLGGATTSAIGLENFSRAYWKNASLFETKWGLLPQVPDFNEDEAAIRKLVTLSEIINPYYPEPHLLKALRELMTSEVRNEIIETEHDRQQLAALIRLMMIIDLRDVLRLLEDRLKDDEFDQHLIYQLIDFYYHKNIYSRCQKYLARIDPDRKSFGFSLLELRVYMGTKDLPKAVEALSRLMQEVSTHPELFKIAADIHRIQGNKAEADEFYALAYQTDPFSYRKM